MSFPFSLPLLLDGATGTNLIRAGMPAGVCVEQWALDHPEAVRSLQRAFVEAGSQAILAPTFGANRAKLKNYGLADQTADFNRRLVALSREAAAGADVLIGGDLSPTGLMVEPYGAASFEEICAVYREQVQALKAAGVDFISAETQMSLADMRAAVLAAKEAGLPVFVSLTIEESGRTVMGADLLPVLITLEAMGADAVGLNCSTGPAAMEELIQNVLPHTSLPLICKPNAGKPCADDPTKYDLTPEAFALEMKRLLDAGARIVGGCCGTTPEHIAALARLLQSEHYAPLPEKEADNYAAAIEGQCFFLGDDVHLTEPIECSYDLSDDLIDIEDEDGNTALVVLNSLEDAQTLAENAMMTRLPIAVHTHDPEVLEAALRDFQGRLLVDSDCPLEREELEAIARRYGAIIY